MSQELALLLGTAATLGLVHTILGPDHYLPFVALSRARAWTLRKTIAITMACGVGHVLGSVALGLLGIALGITVRRLELIESQRGEVAAWLLIGFGLAYTAWAFLRIRRRRPHRHLHRHADGILHSHSHDHRAEHAHPHDHKRTLTPWILFTVFVFGPCEPLIPLLMFPAMAIHTGAVWLVALVFGTVTVATMLVMVLALRAGLRFLTVERLGRYAHVAAGVTVLLCGVAIRLGL